ncbi:MAG TPA: hypothetical protein VH986_01145 [Acidimicrobiia bacterium]|jgi:hypothetical protein
MKRLALLVVALVVVLAGCKVDTTVTVDLHDDGSGVVTVRATLDAEAVHEVENDGGTLEDRIRLTDLTAAGWTVKPWVKSGAGTAQIELSKPFSSPEQVAGIINEVSGADGPLRGFSATREQGTTATDYSVKGTIDLAAAGTGVGADPDLVAALAKQQVDPGAVDQQLLAELRNAVSVSVVVDLPNGKSVTVNGESGRRVDVDTMASVTNTRRLALLGLAVVLVIAAIVALMVGRRKRRARAPIPRFDPHSGGPA